MKTIILFALSLISINASAALTCLVQTQVEDYDPIVETILLQGTDIQVGVSKDKDTTLTYDPRKPGVLNAQLAAVHCIGYSGCSANINIAMNSELNIDFAGLQYQSISCK